MPSKSQRQHDLMLKVSTDKEFSEKLSIPQEVGCEFIRKDRELNLWQNEEEKKELEEILNFVKLQTDKVQSNVTIVGHFETRQPFLFHITPEKNPKYIPRVGYRQHDTEDRTVPRITVADTFFGCLIGYASLMYNFLYGEVSVGSEMKDFANGLYIRKLIFKYALKPNKKLCYDASQSNEHWLVTYNEQSREFQSERIGKFFINQMTIQPKNKGLKDTLFQIYLQLTEPVWFSDTTKLNAGYYDIWFKLNDTATYTQKTGFEIKEITKKEFDEQKTIVASNLTLTNTPSVIKGW